MPAPVMTGVKSREAVVLAMRDEGETGFARRFSDSARGGAAEELTGGGDLADPTGVGAASAERRRDDRGEHA